MITVKMEAFYLGCKYKIITVDGEELIWQPNDSYYNGDFLKDIQQHYPQVKSYSDINTIDEIT